ncbi:MAG: hypothetical protein KA978_31290 [Deltaproteobacteria bacterium]|jgi:hypothetical protein|nr:hypothetical protein [Deltaproteobacteria bacterium]
MAAQQEPVTPEVVYESSHVTVGHRVLVALGSGLAVFGTMSFLRWGFGAVGVDRRALLSSILLGGAVALGLVIAALRSRVVWRVTLDRAASELRIERDPDAVDRWRLSEIAEVRALPVAGGWSRDPSERLSLRLRDGQERVYSLPDDALTEGIANDIRAALSPVELREDVPKHPAGGVAGAGEVREQGVEGAALGPVAVAEPAGDGDRRGG